MTGRLHWLARVLLAGVVLVELLGLLGIVPLEPEFTWSGLLLQSVGTLLGFELLRLWSIKRKLGYAVGIPAVAFAVLIVLDASGDLAHWYGQFSWYDQLAHFYGGFCAGLLATGLLAAVRRTSVGAAAVSRVELFILGTCVALALGGMFEILEYSEDVLTGSHRLGDGFDTANDLVMDVLGGGLAAFIVARTTKKS